MHPLEPFPKYSIMKKLVLLLSFVFVLGLVSLNAQDKKKTITKEAVKTEKVAKKPVEKKIEATKTTTKDKPVVKKKKGKKVEKKAPVNK